MKFPSVQSLLSHFTGSFRRFPLAICAAIAASVFAIIFVHLDHSRQMESEYFWNVVTSCFLGMLLFIAVTAYSERNVKGRSVSILLQFGALVLVVAYYFSLPVQMELVSMVRFLLFAIALHLLIAFAPFIGFREMNGFWQYNKILLLRILVAAIYSSAFYIGLSLAILAINELFKAGISERIYVDLWIAIAGVFNTWFFLAGFPRDFAGLEAQSDYPKGIKIFTQYVLIPLITVFLLILYTYMLKIILIMQWPVGWVSYLVIGFSIAGILSLLLIYPVRNDEENRWIPVFSRFFYVALFPLIVLLFFAIKRRISDYGITEKRYFVLVLALWLIYIAAYFLISKVKNIRLIPVSLCLVALLTSFGPWGAFRVSMKSQQKHLTELLARNGIIENGKASRSKRPLPFDDHREISSVVNYLVDVHGYRSLQPLFAQDLDSLMKVDSLVSGRFTNGRTEKILGLMNISYTNRYQLKDDEIAAIDYRLEAMQSVNISGYDLFVPDFFMSADDAKDSVCNSIQAGSTTYKVCLSASRKIISFSGKNGNNLAVDLSALVRNLQKKTDSSFGSIPAAEMTLSAANENLAAKIIFRSIYCDHTPDSLNIRKVHFDILIKTSMEKENEVGERKQ